MAIGQPRSYSVNTHKYMETIGPERIIFGTDSSYFPRGFAEPYLRDQLRDCYELNYTDEQVQMIFGGNAACLFKLDLQQPAAVAGD
jgi:uncharacterized protein